MKYLKAFWTVFWIDRDVETSGVDANDAMVGTLIAVAIIAMLIVGPAIILHYLG